MKSINEFITEKLKIRKETSEKNPSFNIIKLFEEVMGMRYGDATEDFKNKVNAFAEECIDDYRDIEIVTEKCYGFADATYKIVELGKKYKFERIGPSKWDEYSDIVYKSKGKLIIDVDFGENQIDESITINHQERIFEYTTGGEGSFILKA
jgi:hypothetical protein